MTIESPQSLILIVVGAFLLGWILSSIGSRVGAKVRAKNRDPKDDRIRQLEAELRIERSESSEAREQLETLKTELEAANEGLQKRDSVIVHQQGRVRELERDLKDSIIKTRELRHELTNRAEETVRSEVKLREVETELSVAQASNDMIATGVFDYTLAPEIEEENDEILPAGAPKVAR